MAARPLSSVLLLPLGLKLPVCLPQSPGHTFHASGTMLATVGAQLVFSECVTMAWGRNPLAEQGAGVPLPFWEQVGPGGRILGHWFRAARLRPLPHKPQRAFPGRQGHDALAYSLLDSWAAENRGRGSPTAPPPGRPSLCSTFLWNRLGGAARMFN